MSLIAPETLDHLEKIYKDKDFKKKLSLLDLDDQYDLINSLEKDPAELLRFTKQLAKDNSELTALFDELQQQLSGKIKAGGSYVFEMGEASFKIMPVQKMYPDNRLRYNNRDVDIDEPSKVGKVNFGLATLWKVVSARFFFVEPEGEYTYDPRDKTPIQIKKRYESIIKIKTEITKSSFVERILKGLAGLKKWWETLGWGLIIGGTAISIVLVFVWLLSGYKSSLR